MEQSLLHIEFLPGQKKDGHDDSMNIKMSGDPVLLSKMIATAMDARQDICAAMIAGVLSWCKENNINPDTLKDIVKFH